MSSNNVTTPDGTVYQYDQMGYYTNGTLPWDANLMSPSPAAQPANVLKVTSVTDRQGNVTYYNYGEAPYQAQVTFQKIDGQTTETRLTSVQMPNGHVIHLHWGENGAPTNRITSITDGTRTVTYTYQSFAPYELTSVTTPGGKTTSYGYGDASTPQYWGGDTATSLVTSVTDPRGLTTQMSYTMGQPQVLPYCVQVPESVFCTEVQNPNGTVLFLYNPYITGGTVEKSGFTLYNLNNPGYSVFGSMAASLSQTPAQLTIQTGNAFEYPYIYGWDNVYHYSVYDPNTENELVDESEIGRRSTGPNVAAWREIPLPGWQDQYVSSTTTYNFLGNPLVKAMHEHEDEAGGGSTDRTYQTQYAYWDQTKYFQQKATLDQAGRYTYTDYYTNSAAMGSRGQQEYVYDPKNGGLYLNTNITPPSGTPQNEYWRYQIQPQNAADYSASFAYDSVGRCTDVYKLQSTTSNPWTYVHTQTSYGSNTDGSWGQASQVVEDLGGINRTTQTKSYTAWGKADDVLDAAGHEFTTSYDLDGTVQSVTRTNVTPAVTIASYIYGMTANTVSYGQVLSVTDGLSGVQDSMAYQSSGGGIGQVSQVTESGGPNPSYTVNYQYDVVGNRLIATYTTPNGTRNWWYHDYLEVGDPNSLKWAFQTLTLLDQNLNPTSEEFHYVYDSTGRLLDACFAQTPASGYSPGTGGDWYPMGSEYASSRCRAAYDYDPTGRVRSVYHYWDTWDSGTGAYDTSNVVGNTCEYEFTGLDRGLKTESDFYNGSGSSWTDCSTETYGYDASLDYLTSANYTDGGSENWTYDAAGNRTDSVVDNLNRTTSIGGQSTSCDILGNRLTMGLSTSYGWDCLNRMTSLVNSSGSNSYAYRADGMRVQKSVGSTNTTTLYRYDAQMGFEDVDTPGSGTTVTDYGLGARGIDYISSNNGTTTTVGFPLYDGHGNMIATLARTGQGSYTTGNLREYDAWGSVRSGQTTGDPKGRYCASSGHKSDDETGLVYMRARYYDPSSGRWLSEDRLRQGTNFFSYCRSSPTNRCDGSGEDDLPEWLYWSWISQIEQNAKENPQARVIGNAFLLMLGMWLAADGVIQFAEADSNVIRIGFASQKWSERASFLKDAFLANSQASCGSIEQMAEGEANQYAVFLQVSTWMILDDVL